MKIGIDARFYGKAGPGRYTKNIVEHLEQIDKENSYVIFLRQDGYSAYNPVNKNFKKVLSEYPWYSFKEQTSFMLVILKEKLDLFYVPHFNIPIFYPKKIVTAIPDMTMHTFSTERGTTLPIWYFRIKKMVYLAVFWWAVFRSYKVIVPSLTVLNDFLKNIKEFKKDKYILAYEGIDPIFLTDTQGTEDRSILEKYGISKPFILTIGSMYEHKNVGRLIEMFKILKNKYNYEGQFVMVSKKDKFSERIYKQIKNEGLDNDILVLAFRNSNATSDVVVTDSEISMLRKHALCYVMAALKEGFSLTALEGMAVGLPAALSDIDCHREVYGDSVVYFNPYSPDDIADKVNSLLTNKILRDAYIERGYRQIKKYNWIDTARITLSVFEAAVKKRN